MAIDIGNYVTYKGNAFVVARINPSNNRLLLVNPTSKIEVGLSSVEQLPIRTLHRVEYNGTSYLVTSKNTIISLTTHSVMKWGPENGNRKAILKSLGVVE